MAKRILLPLLAATVLAGCSFAPEHSRPPFAAAPLYPPEYQPEAGMRKATEIGWKDFFTDPRLQAVIQMALDNNRDLRISVERIAEARGQYRIQNSARLPEIALDGGFTRSRTNNGQFNLPGGGTVGGPETLNRYDIGVGVASFELDFWGRVANLSEAARSTYLSTVAAERAFRLSLIRDVAVNYLQAREQAERIALAEQTVSSRQEGLRIAKLRLDAGVTSALDYRQAETLLTQAETELANLRLARAQTRNYSYVLVGRPIPDDLPDPLPMARQGIIRDIGPGLPSDLLNNRPDILAAEEQLRAARANVGAARAAFFPTISLTGSAGFASNQLDGLFKDGGTTWSFGPSIRLPIFDWGATKGNLSVAVARENIAVATYEKTVQTAFREVADALAGRRWLADQVAAQERAANAQRRLAELARSRYDNGVAQYIEVLDAERNLFSAEQSLIQLRRAELANLVSLYVALGGGLTSQE
ncbi:MULTISPECIES: efflux transporter outer membrane subunit [Sphingomonadales]|uniref:RND transporter n=2 Tax=Edaphosphingomonas TaxID=3423724 RepID=A0A2T4I8G9_9SPHN|nr:MULTISPECIES: efflux transporter outer membrane subunit [Sphingomonas]AGH49857.1 RND-family efflux transporter [Sphingomonas sp. MM-1]MDX3883882.1 efflux transporter outer membrane subunit [Sphingomonas sp.]OHT18172.1 Outer membrane protein OprM precursor [Sphingomonas haloaromaticamans]PTD28027.1 RND transporter [Sphingomonas fennica]